MSQNQNKPWVQVHLWIIYVFSRVFYREMTVDTPRESDGSRRHRSARRSSREQPGTRWVIEISWFLWIAQKALWDFDVPWKRIIFVIFFDLVVDFCMRSAFQISRSFFQFLEAITSRRWPRYYACMCAILPWCGRTFWKGACQFVPILSFPFFAIVYFILS